MQSQMSFFRGQPDDEAIRMLQYFETLALQADPRGYCVCTSEGKDSRVLGHLMRRAGVKHFYLHSITGIDPPELIYFQRRNFQKYRDMGYLTYAYWTDADIWNYSYDANLEQCCLYGEGFDRLGCIGCPMAGCDERKREFERWPKFERLYILAFDRMFIARNERGLKNIFSTGRDCFDWWMSDKAQESADEDQLLLDGWTGVDE